jgi:RimJ/RimL family protein N-acetyltransferase
MENIPQNRFIVDKKHNKFQLVIKSNLAAISHFSIEEPDELFDQKYLGLFKLKTNEKFRGKGYMKYLLSEIFKYSKTNLNINHVLLNVYTDNSSALNLYLNQGFEIYGEYEDDKPYYTLIKHL